MLEKPGNAGSIDGLAIKRGHSKTGENEDAAKKFAMLYAEKQGIVYDVINPQPRKLNIKSYADNFRQIVRFLGHTNFNFKIYG